MNLQRLKAQCLPMRGVLRFGGDSESDASSTQVDKKTTQGERSINVQDVGGGVVINQTAPEAFAMVDSAIGKTQAMTKDLTTQAFHTINTTADTLRTAYEDAKGRGAMTDTITLTAIAGACVVAVMALKKGKA